MTHTRNNGDTSRAPQPRNETVADFKQRIAIIMRERETGKKYSVVGASRIPEWCEKQAA